MSQSRYPSMRGPLLHTAISRKVVEKVHATISIGIVGGFEFTNFQRNLKEWHERPCTYICKCLGKATKVSSTATVSGTVNWSYPILPFGIVACTCFSDNLSRNSCTKKQRELQYSKYGSTKVQFRIFFYFILVFVLHVQLGYFNHNDYYYIF